MRLGLHWSPSIQVLSPVCKHPTALLSGSLQPGGSASSNQSVLVQRLRREVAADESRLASADFEPGLGLLQCEATSFPCV